MTRLRLARGLSLAWVAVAVAVGMSGGAACAEAPALPLVPHHASYKLSLVRSTGSKAPENVEGLLSYDFSGSSCDGYAMTLRQMTALQPQEGETHVSDMQTASFEGGDSKEYRFKVATTGDPAGGSTIDGQAHRTPDGAVSVDLDQPQTEKAALPAGVLFPTEHLKAIIAMAKTGGKLLSAAVFDGSDTGTKMFNTLSVIGAQVGSVPPEKAAQIDALKTVPRWPVTISYFDAAKSDGAPDYVLTFDLYENGISRALKLDYGDFVLGGEMTELDLKPDSACAH